MSETDIVIAVNLVVVIVAVVTSQIRLYLAVKSIQRTVDRLNRNSGAWYSDPDRVMSMLEQKFDNLDTSRKQRVARSQESRKRLDAVLAEFEPKNQKKDE